MEIAEYVKSRKNITLPMEAIKKIENYHDVAIAFPFDSIAYIFFNEFSAVVSYGNSISFYDNTGLIDKLTEQQTDKLLCVLNDIEIYAEIND